MTQSESKQFVFDLVKTMIKNESYIKGYGTLFRVMSKDHSPLQNITKQQMDILKLNSVVYQDNLVFRLNDFNNPFKHPSDVKLPQRGELI